MADFNNFQNQLYNLNNTKDHTAEFGPSDIEKNKLMALLSYLSWLVLIPIFAARESAFARFHVNQGLVLAISELVICGILGILDGIPIIGFIFGIANALVGLCCTILSIIGIINALNGRAKELPLIGGIRLLK